MPVVQQQPEGSRDERDAGYTLVETVVAAVVLVTALLPVVAAVLYVSADPTPRWTAEAVQRAQDEAERTVRLDPALWTDEALEDGLWRARRRVSRDAVLVAATIEVWREGSTEDDPLVSLRIARLTPPRTAAP